MATNKAQTCRNAMEFLVTEEIERQIKLIPPRLAKYMSLQEISAFALNRLPCLYATSERGWRQQCLKGKRDYATQISNAVRQGLIAVQKDPLRVETPLAPSINHEVDQALADLKLVLQCEELSWQNLAGKVKESLMRTAQGELVWQNSQQTSKSNTNQRSAWCTAYYRY